MKTRYWIAILACIALLSVLACFVLRPSLTGTGSAKSDADSVRVVSNGRLITVLPLSEDTELLVPTQNGYNTVTVKDGKVSVTAASCSNHTCMNCGERSCGAPIICLPNRLVLQFCNSGGLDAVTN